MDGNKFGNIKTELTGAYARAFVGVGAYGCFLEAVHTSKDPICIKQEKALPASNILT